MKYISGEIKKISLHKRKEKKYEEKNLKQKKERIIATKGCFLFTPVYQYLHADEVFSLLSLLSTPTALTQTQPQAIYLTFV